ncbi:Micronuclear linker histone polyprotein-like protein [Quillaja saponaria]|uniref:Micronuclear linker histone polyprotein-like protein n=1 Tax=Quillaja saponaria TaxID=32244 RepID=A0AAD7KYG6_QUISA|nr:Micronuclear linker histone polyprotein-like protein [Quillaja saponaria]
MSIGGPYNKGMHSNNGWNRGRRYGLMLLLAFGAALFGVMVLHRLRERRIYNLLIKEKDRQLIALQLLLQKERDSNQEIKRKNEEMKAKIYSIKTQKMELDRKVLELQSRMDSLKDEQRVMETAFEEKQNEIRMLTREKVNLGKEITNPEVIALTESLKQKEAELEDLKHRLQDPVKVWSVSTDDPSKLPVDLTVNGRMAGDDQSTINGNGENITKDAIKDKSTKYKESETAMIVENGNENREGNTERRDVIEEQMQKQGKLQVETQSSDGEGIVYKNEDSDESVVVGGKEKESVDEGKQGKLEHSVDGGGGDIHSNYKGGFKLKMSDNSRGATGLGTKGKSSRGKGKRWRMIVQNRMSGKDEISESHRAANIRSRKLYKDQQDGQKNGTEVAAANDDKVKEEGGGMGNSSFREDKVEAELGKPKNPKDGRDGKTKIVNDQVAKERLDENNDSQESRTGRHIKKVECNAEQAEAGKLHEVPESLKVTKIREQGKDAFEDDDVFRGSVSDLEDDKQQHKEELDESEFQPDKKCS